jgi:Lon protease-like protein
MFHAYAVFEPRYLELFRSLQGSTAAGMEPSFGHILAASSAPPVLMQQSVGGLPPIGVCATVKSMEELSGGRLQVGNLGSC